MKSVPMTNVTVTRDAMTRLNVTVPSHEVSVMRLIFGEDNVQVFDDAAGSIELDPATEGERLADKYGRDAVAQIYGANLKGAVAQAVNDLVAKQPKGRVNT